MEWIKLGELVDIRKGTKLTEVDNLEDDNAIRMIMIEDLRNDDKIKYVIRNEKNVVVNPKDTIIAWDGANAGLVGFDLEGAIGSTLARLSLKNEKVYPNYFGLYLQSKFREIRDNCTGATIPHVNRNYLVKMKIPLPPINIQKQIVEVLDEAQSIIDNRKDQIKLLDDLIESIFYNMFGDPVKNDKGWEVDFLKNNIHNIDSGWSPNCNSNQAPVDKWGILKLSAVTGKIYNSSKNKELPEGIEPKEQNEVKVGDLLITRKNTPDLVGDSCYIFETRNKLMLPDTIFRINTKDTINKLFLLFLLNNKTYKYRIKGLASGSAKSMSNISKEKLKKIEILFPPIQLQNQFAAKVEVIQKQKQLLEDSLKLLEDNYNNLMQRAFKGQLF